MTTRHLTKDKGDLAVAMTLAHLRANNIYACLPISEHLPFDLIAVMPDMMTLRRVQVKYRAAKDGRLTLFFRGNYYDSKKIYTKRVNLEEMDTYAAYCPDTQQNYYVRVNELHDDAVTFSLRLEPPKNNQKNGVWLAENYIDPHRMGVCEPV